MMVIMMVIIVVMVVRGNNCDHDGDYCDDGGEEE